MARWSNRRVEFVSDERRRCWSTSLHYNDPCELAAAPGLLRGHVSGPLQEALSSRDVGKSISALAVGEILPSLFGFPVPLSQSVNWAFGGRLVWLVSLVVVHSEFIA